MKKKFTVIDNKYVVDKEASLKEGGFWLHPKNVVFPYTETYLKAFNTLKEVEKSAVILATIGEENRIEGLPVIVFENNYMSLARESTVMNNYDIENDTYKHGYVVGYGEAKSKGCWTDKDMQKAMLSMGSWCSGIRMRDAIHGVDVMKKAGEILTNLKQPNIQKIELEVEEKPAIHLTEGSRRCNNLPPILALKTTTSDKGDVIIIQKPNI